MRNPGNYQPQIIDALQKASLDPNNKGVSTNTLFHCVGGNNGDIEVVKFCTNRCVDGGPGKSDVCNEASSGDSSTTSTSTLSQTSGTTVSTSTRSTTASSSGISGAPTAPSADNGSSQNTPVGAIAGGVVGGVAGLALIGLGLFLFFKRSRQARKSQDENTTELKSTREELLKGFNGAHSTTQDGTVHEAPGDMEIPRYELSGAQVNSAETRHELG